MMADRMCFLAGIVGMLVGMALDWSPFAWFSAGLTIPRWLEVSFEVFGQERESSDVHACN